MMAVVSSFLEQRDQLVHFVPSPEGLWTIHITSQFQMLIIDIRNSNAIACASSLLQAIFKVFTEFENVRSAGQVDAFDRSDIGSQYLINVKNYKLSNLFKDVPSLTETCRANVSKDARLFNMSLVKWNNFSEITNNGEGVIFEFDYTNDIIGGLKPFFLPG